MRQIILVLGLLIFFNISGQIHVEGIVYDIDGNPLPGVNVIESKGGEPGTVTNIEGQFSIYCYYQTPALYFMRYKYETNVVIVDSTYFVSLEMEHKDRQHYKRYEGKKAGKLFDGISGHIESHSFIDEPSGNLAGVKFGLTDSSVLKIYFKKLRHVKQTDKNSSWDQKKLRKERIEMINHFINKQVLQVSTYFIQ